MNKEIKDTYGVDTGGVSIIDCDFIKKNGGTKEHNDCNIVLLEKGIYDIHVIVPDSLLGKIDERAEIVCESGHIYIGDDCYCFSRDDRNLWLKYLDLTDYHRDLKLFSGHHVHLGGDGSVEISVKFTKKGELHEQEASDDKNKSSKTINV